MNLQPINPPLQPGQKVQCSACLKMVTSAKADLDAPAGTFICPICDTRESQLNQVARSIREGDGCPVEADEKLNAANRALVGAMWDEHGGRIFCGRFNGRGDTKAGVWPAESASLYNFEADFVLPAGVGVEEVRQAIRDREEAPYTGTADDYPRVKRIQDAIDRAGGHLLIWS